MGRKALVTLLIGLICAVPATIAIGAPQKIGGPDPAVQEWPEWPHRVICGYLPIDPVSAFSGPTDAERGSLPSERAVRRFLGEDVLSWVPKHNWRLASESHGIAEFAAGRLRKGVEWMSFQRTRGRWKFLGYAGGCLPNTLRRGQSAITWDLSEDQPSLGAQSHRIKVYLGPGECNDGKSQNDRLQKPEFREQNSKLIMTLWLRPVSPGLHTCVGLIEPPVVIELPEPLGERELLDGGTYPPRPAAEPDPER